MSLKERSKNYLVELQKLFKFLSNSPAVCSVYSDISASARALENTVKQALRHIDRPASISIEPNWNIAIDPHDICGLPGTAQLYIGGRIEYRDGELNNQSLTAVITFEVSENGNAAAENMSLQPGRTYLVRKIHYDFDKNLDAGDRPVQHMQIGGKLNTHYLYGESSAPEEFEHERFPQLDLPRIPYPIADLATLLEVLLKQFNNEKATFLDETGWVERVCAMEGIWLRHYYETALEVLNKQDRKYTLYRHQCSQITS